MSALRRIALAGTRFAHATCGTIRLKLLRIGALVTTSVRRIKIAMASGHPWQPSGEGVVLLSQAGNVRFRSHGNLESQPDSRVKLLLSETHLGSYDGSQLWRYCVGPHISFFSTFGFPCHNGPSAHLQKQGCHMTPLFLQVSTRSIVTWEAER